jgi:hypothetical protein
MVPLNSRVLRCVSCVSGLGPHGTAGEARRFFKLGHFPGFVGCIGRMRSLI